MRTSGRRKSKSSATPRATVCVPTNARHVARLLAALQHTPLAKVLARKVLFGRKMMFLRQKGSPESRKIIVSNPIPHRIKPAGPAPSAGLPIDDTRIREIMELAPPSHLLREFPTSDVAAKTTFEGRSAVHRVLHGGDDRLLVVVGPCSIHDYDAAIDYATRLAALKRDLADELVIVMRVYFEKPRTTVGWKGLINDPRLDASFRINEGLRLARRILLEINELELSAGTEYLDMITPQYIADLIAWGAIGARTTESQVHRQLASGLSCPVGFKNGTDGGVKVAVDAVKAASAPHHFLSVTKGGHSAIVHTSGNEDCHIILT